MTLRVALTGGIATGKSYVRERLAALGVPTIDADRIVHELLGPGTAVTEAIRSRFGAAVLGAAGGVDRPALARVVFGDPDLRRALEAIVHPEVYHRIAAWMAEHAEHGAPVAVADIPLLYETGHEGDFDLVVVVACEPERQIERVMARDGAGEAAAAARLRAQWPIQEKARRADVLIRTDGTFDQTDRQVEALHRRLTSRR